MSLINSLGKHPASNASCLDGEAVTSPAAPSPGSSSPRPPGAGAGAGPGCGCAWPWRAEPGGYVPRGAALPQLASGRMGVWLGRVPALPGVVVGSSLSQLHLSGDSPPHCCEHPNPKAGPAVLGELRSRGKVVSCFTGAVFGSNGSCRVAGGWC